MHWTQLTLEQALVRHVDVGLAAHYVCCKEGND